MAKAHPDLMESALVLSYQSQGRAETQETWEAMVKDRRLMQSRFGTSVFLFGAFWLWLQVFGSAPLYLQYLAMSAFEPMLLAAVCGLIAWAQHDAGRIAGLVVPSAVLIAWVIWAQVRHMRKVEPVLDANAVHPVMGDADHDEDDREDAAAGDSDGPLDQPPEQSELLTVAAPAPPPREVRCAAEGIEVVRERDKDDDYDDAYEDYDYDDYDDRSSVSVSASTAIPEATLAQMVDSIRDRICAELNEKYGEIVDAEGASGSVADGRHGKGRKTKQQQQQRGITSEKYVSLFEKQFNEEFATAKRLWKAQRDENGGKEQRDLSYDKDDAGAKLSWSWSRSYSGSGSGSGSYSYEGGAFISGSSSSASGSRAEASGNNGSSVVGSPQLPPFLMMAKERIYDELVAEFGDPRGGSSGAAAEAEGGEGAGQSGGCTISTDEFMRLFEERLDAEIVAFVRGGDSDSDDTSSSDFIAQEFARMDAERAGGGAAK